MADDTTPADPPEVLCDWTDDVDEKRRVFVFVQFGGASDIEKMDKICRWLKDGSLPHKLKAIKD